MRDEGLPSHRAEIGIHYMQGWKICLGLVQNLNSYMFALLFKSNSCIEYKCRKMKAKCKRRITKEMRITRGKNEDAP